MNFNMKCTRGGRTCLGTTHIFLEFFLPILWLKMQLFEPTQRSGQATIEMVRQQTNLSTECATNEWGTEFTLMAYPMMNHVRIIVHPADGGPEMHVYHRDPRHKIVRDIHMVQVGEVHYLAMVRPVPMTDPVALALHNTRNRGKHHQKNKAKPKRPRPDQEMDDQEMDDDNYTCAGCGKGRDGRTCRWVTRADCQLHWHSGCLLREESRAQQKQGAPYYCIDCHGQ